MQAGKNENQRQNLYQQKQVTVSGATGSHFIAWEAASSEEGGSELADSQDRECNRQDTRTDAKARSSDSRMGRLFVLATHHSDRLAARRVAFVGDVFEMFGYGTEETGWDSGVASSPTIESRKIPSEAEQPPGDASQLYRFDPCPSEASLNGSYRGEQTPSNWPLRREIRISEICISGSMINVLTCGEVEFSLKQINLHGSGCFYLHSAIIVNDAFWVEQPPRRHLSLQPYRFDPCPRNIMGCTRGKNKPPR
jgi:hypothetical protein